MARSKTKNPPHQELVQKEQQGSADLSLFVPALNQWVENQSDSAKLNHEIEKEELSVIRESNKYSFWLLLVVVLGVFAIASGLMFGLNQLDAGLLVLSHVGAVIAGLLAGMGLERHKTNPGND